MKKYFLSLSLWLIAVSSAMASPIILKKAQVEAQSQDCRLILETSARASFRISAKSTPSYWMIEIPHAQTTANFSLPNNTAFKKISLKPQKGGHLQLIVESAVPLKLKKTFSEKVTGKREHRWVVEFSKIFRQKPSKPALLKAELSDPKMPALLNNQRTTALAFVPSPPAVASAGTQMPRQHATTVLTRRSFVVALDPGHGGWDPGAVGPSGAYEKDIVLSIAKILKELIDKEPGMKAVLTRQGDYYMDLKQRVRKARHARADLFISLHADAFYHTKAHGASVFTLSERGASSAAAQWLAEAQNKSGILGNLRVPSKNAQLANLLLDLSQTASQRDSFDAGRAVLQSLGRMTHLHKTRVEQAGFAVLKAPDMPSMLIETGFLSHPVTEIKLQTTGYQKSLATAIFLGLRHYHHNKLPSKHPSPVLQINSPVVKPLKTSLAKKPAESAKKSALYPPTRS